MYVHLFIYIYIIHMYINDYACCVSVFDLTDSTAAGLGCFCAAVHVIPDSRAIFRMDIGTLHRYHMQFPLTALA